MVDNLDNGGELAGVLTLVDKDDTANLDQSPVGSLNGSFSGHLWCYADSF